MLTLSLTTEDMTGLRTPIPHDTHFLGNSNQEVKFQIRKLFVNVSQIKGLLS